MDKLGQAKAFLPAFSLLVFFISTNAVAGTGCATLFSTTYPGSQTDDNAGCQTCHERAGGGPFNPYGSDLRANGAAGAGFNCDVVTAEIDFDAALAAVENLDSDNDNGGFSNIDEITAGTQPGWCVFVAGGTCLETALALPAGDLDPAPANQAPLADAGGPYEGVAGTTLIQFDGSGSTDADNDPLTFDWEVVDKPDGAKVRLGSFAGTGFFQSFTPGTFSRAEAVGTTARLKPLRPSSPRPAFTARAGRMTS